MEPVSLELVVLGCNGSGPGLDGPASGYVVTSERVALWVDAGTGTFMALTEVMDPADVDAIVISHVHADHCADVLGFVHYAAYRIGLDRAIPLLAPTGVVERLSGFFAAGPDHPFFSVLAPTEVGDGSTVEIGDVRLRFAAAAHSVPANSVRFESGSTLVYSGDTGPGGGFPALATGADAVLCEAGLDAPRATAEFQLHLSGGEAGAIAREAGARSLILTHLPPTLAPADVLEAAQSQFTGPVELARPGLRRVI